MENPQNIRADMVELTEFPFLANKYRVMGVPLTVVNERTFVEGARPEPRYLEDVLAAVEPPPMTA
jgi:hypothetical protein